MDTSKKIIRGVVNSRGFTITSAITQWDYGWQFIPEIEDLPATYRLDFSNEEKHGTALPVYCSTEGAEVPTELIDTGKDVWVWFVRIGDGFGITEYKWRVPNKCKPKTEQDEPTPSQQSSIDQLIVRSNEAVETAEQKAEEADESARSASDDADRAERARTGAETAQGKAEEAQESAERAKDDAETSERNASESERKAKGYAETASEKADAITGLTAQATTLPDGSSASASYDAQTGVMSFGIPKGKDGTNGIDGDDGYSPTANVSKSGKVATITITDKNGTTSAQVEDGTDGTDGYSPTVTITPITGGHRIAITDADGTETADVMDGDDYILTEEDKEEIADMVEIPSDWLKAFPTDIASGAVASFTDGADNLPFKSLVVDINPVQDLSHGDPSPENICPISGWTQVGVEQSGKNLLKNNATNGSANGVTWTINSDGSILFSGTATATTDITMNRLSAPLVIGKGQMALVINGSALYNPTITGINFQSDIYVDGTYVSTLQNGNTKRTFSGGLITVGLSRIRIASGTVIPSDTVFYPQIEIGNAPSAYEPYTGRSITIDLGQTVYGGKLDVLSGELTVYPYYASYNGETLTGEWISDRDKYVAGTTPTIGAQVVNIGAQGVTVQLEPHEVASLLGQNNIFADTGDTSAEYRADTKLYINKKIAEAISALS